MHFPYLLLLAINIQAGAIAGPIQERSKVPDLARRQPISAAPTCGFLNGDPSQPRTANPGFTCMTDTQNGLWGFCTTAGATGLQECGIPGNCVDGNACSSGCGTVGNPAIPTFTCLESQFCSTAILTDGSDQSYSYIACGITPDVEHFLATPTAESHPTTAPSSSSIVATVAPAGATVFALSPPTSTTSPPAGTTAFDGFPDLSPSTSTSFAPESSTSTPFTLDTSTSPLYTPPSPTFTSSPPASSISIPSTPASLTSASPRPSSQPDNIGAIVGGIVGSVTLICFVSLAFLLIRRLRAGRVGDSPKELQTALSPPKPRFSRFSHMPRKSWGRRDPVELPDSEF